MFKALQRLIAKIKRAIRARRKRIILSRISRMSGGDSARSDRRRMRQMDIRAEKRAIVEGLLRSWQVGEIKPPQGDIRETLTYFDHGLSLKQLRELEEYYWS